MGFILLLDFNIGCFGIFGWTEREENWEQAKTKKCLSFLFGVSRVLVKKRRENELKERVSVFLSLLQLIW